MELKVWVEGIQRIVCGVTVNTTCQDVVFALAHATGKVGRFTLIERWRNNERLLAPNENPLKLLLKWGEYANDVHFILQRSENKQQLQQQQQTTTNESSNSTTTNISNSAAQQKSQNANNNNNNNSISNSNNNNNNNNSSSTSSDIHDSQTNAVMMMMTRKPLGLSNNNNHNNSTSNNSINNNNRNNSSNIESALNVQQQSQQQQQQQQPQQIQLEDRTKQLKKSFGAYDGKQIDNIGIVKGIPQQQQQPPPQRINLNIINNNPQQQQQQQQKSAIPIIMQQQPQQNQTTNSPLNSTHSHSSSSRSPSITTTSSSINATPYTATTTATITQQHGGTAATFLYNAKQHQPRHEKSHSNPIEMSSTTSVGMGGGHTGMHANFGAATLEYGHSDNSNNNNNNTNNIYQQLGAHNSKSINEINLAEVRNALDKRNLTAGGGLDAIGQPNAEHFLFTTNNTNNNNNNNMSNSSENLLDAYNGNAMKFNASPPDLYKNAPTISANGALVPPPYRDPPPPRNSPQLLSQQQPQQQQQQQQQQLPQRMQTDNAPSPININNSNTNPFLNDYSNDYDLEYRNVVNMDESESIFQATQYNDLLQLIKFQREKISTQQMELSKYDAEIVFLENKERDQAQELEAISREITKADQLFRQGSEQLQALQYVEEENELVKQQEKTLKSEIALLRSKLANCETELLQCKNKIHLLMDDIEVEQRAIKTNRQNIERDFLMEMERIQSEIDQAIHNTDTSNKTADNLKKEIVLIENAISEKKRQVEQLVNEMKEVNLQSLTVTTSEEIRHLLEGPHKPGSTRRIIGSPRQLENAVPTSKNPHGVWV